MQRLSSLSKAKHTMNAIEFNTLRPRQNGRHFADDSFKCISLNENVWIPIKISLKFVPKGPINNIPALVQIKAWRRQGDKPLSEPMMVSLYMRHSASMSQMLYGFRYSTPWQLWNDCFIENWSVYLHFNLIILVEVYHDPDWQVLLLMSEYYKC